MLTAVWTSTNQQSLTLLAVLQVPLGRASEGPQALTRRERVEEELRAPRPGEPQDRIPKDPMRGVRPVLVLTARTLVLVEWISRAEQVRAPIRAEPTQTRGAVAANYRVGPASHAESRSRS